MAALAGDLRVAAAERKSRRLVVIEADRRPLLGCVTGFTTLAVPTRMLVLQTVAGDAGARKILVAFSGVAFPACNLAVCANERKLRLTVIKGLDPAPSLLGVTAVACLTQTPLVAINGLVTVEATRGGPTELSVLCMAAVAAYPLVGAQQREVGVCMVEGLAIELNDVESAPLVVSVTDLALPLGGFGMAPVKAPHRLPICRDGLVARKAQPGLRLARKRFMTVAAILFQLRVSAGERSRHDKLFKDAL